MTSPPVQEPTGSCAASTPVKERKCPARAVPDKAEKAAQQQKLAAPSQRTSSKNRVYWRLVFVDQGEATETMIDTLDEMLGQEWARVNPMQELSRSICIMNVLKWHIPINVRLRQNQAGPDLRTASGALKVATETVQSDSECSLCYEGCKKCIGEGLRDRNQLRRQRRDYLRQVREGLRQVQ